MDRVDLFNNLVVMAAVDGKISDEEAAHLAGRAIHWGISEEEAEQAIANAMSEERGFSVPGTKEGCLEVLAEIIKMMRIDGELASIEKALCSSAAEAMEITPEEFKQVLDSTT